MSEMAIYRQLCEAEIGWNKPRKHRAVLETVVVRFRTTQPGYATFGHNCWCSPAQLEYGGPADEPVNRSPQLRLEFYPS